MPLPRKSQENKKRANRPPSHLTSEQKLRRTAAPESLAQKAPSPPPQESPLQRTAERELALPLTAAWKAPRHRKTPQPDPPLEMHPELSLQLGAGQLEGAQ